MKLASCRLFWLVLLLVQLSLLAVSATDSAPAGNSSSPSTSPSPTTSPSADSPSPSSSPSTTPISPTTSPTPTDTPTTSPTDTPSPKPSPTDSPTESPTSPNPQPNPSPSDTNTPNTSPSNSPSQAGTLSPSPISGSSFFTSSGFQTLSSLSSVVSSIVPSQTSLTPSASSTNTLCIADASGANNTCSSPDQYCDTTSSFCLAKLQNGASCSADNQCTSNFCQSGICAAASSSPSVGAIVGGVIGGVVGLALLIFIARKCVGSNHGFEDENEYKHQLGSETPSEFDGATSNGAFFGGFGIRRGSDPNVAQAKRRGRGITPSMVIEASHPEMQEMSNFSTVPKGNALTSVSTPNAAFVAPLSSHHDRQMDSHRPAQSAGQENWQNFKPAAVDAPSKRRSVYNVLSGALAQMRNGQAAPLVEEDEDTTHLAPAKMTDVYRSSVETTRQKELQSQQKFLEKFVTPKAAAAWPVAEIMAEPRTSKDAAKDAAHTRHPSNASTANASTAANTKHQSNTSIGGKSRASSIYPSIGDYQDEEMLPQIHQSVLEAVMSEQELEQPPSFNQDISRQSTDSDIINDKPAKYSSNNPFADSAKMRPDSDAASVGTSIAAQRQLRQLRERETVETLAPENSKRAISRYSTNSDYSEYEASSVRSSMAFDENNRQSIIDNRLSESSKYDSGFGLTLPTDVAADVTTAMKASPADAQRVVITPADSEPAAAVSTAPVPAPDTMPASASAFTPSLQIPPSVASNTRKEELATLDAHLRGMSQDLGFRLSSVSMDDNAELKETLSASAQDSSFKRLSTKFTRDDVVDWEGLFKE